jgi:flagellar protein FliO/FliZ
MPKKSLFLIEVRGREYLVGSGGDSLNLIASIDDENHSNSTFESILKDTESSKPA